MKVKEKKMGILELCAAVHIKELEKTTKFSYDEIWDSIPEDIFSRPQETWDLGPEDNVSMLLGLLCQILDFIVSVADRTSLAEAWQMFLNSED